MDYRKGTCSQCGAEYNVPASFTHSQARCKKCPGTVNLGPPQSADTAQPQELVEVQTTDAETKRKQRGTLARLRAERAAAGAKADSQPMPASKVPAKTAGASEAPTKLSGRAAGAAKAAGAKSAASEAKTRPTGRPSAGAKAGRTSTAGSARPRRGAAGKAGSKRGKDKASSGRRAGKKDEKKKSPLLLVLLLLVVVGGGGFATWKFLLSGEDGPNSETQAAETATNEAGLGLAGGGDDATDPTGTTEADPDSTEEAASAEEAAEEGEPEAEPAPEEAEKPKAKKVDVLADLSILEPCNRARGTTDEEWEEMSGWMQDFLDPDSGAAGPRAGKKLANMGRKAMPVLINGLLTLDYSTEEGINIGDGVQRMLKTIANGNNFNWGYQPDPRAEYLCRGATAQWHKWWKLIEGDIAYFIKLAKLEQEYSGDGPDPLGPIRAQRKAEAAKLRAQYGKDE